MKATAPLLPVAAFLLLCIAALPAVTLAAPDLVVATFNPPSGAVERTFSIPNAIMNAGTSGSGAPFTVGFVLSSDTLFTLDDTLIGTRDLRPLGAGATTPVNATDVTIPDSVPDGLYYLGMFVDTSNTVTESNELNNFQSDPDPIALATPTPTPDLPPGPVTALHVAETGTTWIRWEWTDPADPDLDCVGGHISLGTGDYGMIQPFEVPPGTGSRNATGLVPGALFTIAMESRDAAGQVGGYVQHSAFTARDPSYQDPAQLPVFRTNYREIYDLTTNESGFVFGEGGETAVYVFSPTLSYLDFWYGEPPLQVSAVASGPGDTVYAAGSATVNGSYGTYIRKYSSTGTILADWPVRDNGSIISMAVDGNGDIYALVQGRPWLNGHFEKYAPDGTFLFQWGSIGTGPGQLAAVDKTWGSCDIAVDRDSNLFVADTDNHRIQKFDENGTFLLAWGSEGNAETEFNFPTSVAVDSGGNITVTDRYSHRIKRFTGTGQFVTAWSCQEIPTDDPLQMTFPMRVTVAKNGVTYVSGTNCLIIGFAPGGVVPTPTPTTIPPTAPPGPGQVPGGSGAPRDLSTDGRYEDVNGNGRSDFADVVLYFNQMSWIAANEPVSAFDFNGNGRIDFADVVWLFNHL